MIDFLGIHKVQISALKLDFSYERYMSDEIKSQEVKDMAESIEDTGGPIHLPVVRDSDKRLISGRTRMAAIMYNGMSWTDVRLCECNDDEMFRIERIENVSRRHDVDEQQQLIVELVEHRKKELEDEKKAAAQKAIEEDRPVEKPATVGRPKKTKTVAREQVAKELGMSPAAVRMVEDRHRKKKEKEVEGTFQMLDFACWGIDVKKSVMAQWVKLKDDLQEIAIRLQSAQVLITHWRKQDTPPPFHPAVMDRIYDEIKTTKKYINSQIPYSLCPYCKGTKHFQDNCKACGGLGWIPVAMRKDIPAELTDDFDPMIQVNGMLHRLEDVEGSTDLLEVVEDDDWGDDQ
jgi:hypothetical protein